MPGSVPVASVRHMQPLSIRYNRVMAVAALVVGVLLAAVSLLSQSWISVLAGVVLIALGSLMVVNPIVRVEPGEVQLRNPIGMTLKRFPVTSPQDLTLDGTTLRHVPTQKKIATLGFGANKDDVTSLKAQLGAAS